MEWNIRDDLPIYSQLIAQMEFAIACGHFAPGDRLPSVRDMAAEAGVNPNTMQRALQELERKGLVYAQRTSGRFITEDTKLIDSVRRSLADERIRMFLGSMEKLGYTKAEILELVSGKKEEL